LPALRSSALFPKLVILAALSERNFGNKGALAFTQIRKKLSGFSHKFIIV
jgi:hypothetical protein